MPAKLKTEQHKSCVVSSHPSSLFSVLCSLHCNFRLPFLGALKTHKDDKWFFYVASCTPHSSMHCCSVLQRVIGLSGVTIFCESHRTYWVQAPHCPPFLFWGACGVWVAWQPYAGMLTPPRGTLSSISIFFYSCRHAQSSQLERLTISHISDLLMWCNLFIS